MYCCTVCVQVVAQFLSVCLVFHIMIKGNGMSVFGMDVNTFVSI